MGNLLKTATLFILIAAMVCSLLSCSEQRGNSASDDLGESALTETDSAMKSAESAARDTDIEEGDVIVVYDELMMIASCYRYENGRVEKLYDGDYKGSYDNLKCIKDGEYDGWQVLIYRRTAGDDAPKTTAELDALAQSFLNDYVENYGEPRAGSYICISDPDGNQYQYVSRANGSVEALESDDVRYGVWESSEQADDYWAKSIRNDSDGFSCVLYEYDKQVSKAYNHIADMINAISVVRDIKPGTLFICDVKTMQNEQRYVAMQYFDGAVYYIQPRDLDVIAADTDEFDTSGIKDAPDNVSVYIPQN